MWKFQRWLYSKHVHQMSLAAHADHTEPFSLSVLHHLPSTCSNHNPSPMSDFGHEVLICHNLVLASDRLRCVRAGASVLLQASRRSSRSRSRRIRYQIRLSGLLPLLYHLGCFLSDSNDLLSPRTQFRAALCFSTSAECMWPIPLLAPLTRSSWEKNLHLLIKAYRLLPNYLQGAAMPKLVVVGRWSC